MGWNIFKSRLKGYIDALDRHHVAGWAAYSDGSVPRLKIRIDGVTACEIVPRISRPDLSSLFGGQINFGFHYRFREPLVDDTEIAVTDDRSKHLTGSPQRIQKIQTEWLDGAKRAGLSSYYIRGRGLEIGALHNPLSVPLGTTVRHVDRMSRSELYVQYPELSDYDLINPDVIANGETLDGFLDESENFIIANHFLEHTQDPIGTIRNFIRVLRPGGVLFLTLPDKNATFDCDRPLTSFEHLVHDHEEGPSCSRHEHFVEWVRLKEKINDSSAEGRIQHLENIDYSIHFHVWEPTTFVGFLSQAILKYNLNLEILTIMTDREEFFVVLKKSSKAQSIAPPRQSNACESKPRRIELARNKFAERIEAQVVLRTFCCRVYVFFIDYAIRRN
jgi:predicted SAM-dependent methyltransferase